MRPAGGITDFAELEHWAVFSVVRASNQSKAEQALSSTRGIYIDFLKFKRILTNSSYMINTR